jgi:putative transposase
VSTLGPNDRRIKVGRGTIDRWIRAYRCGGFEALAPESRTGEPVTEKRLLDLAEALKREVSRRTAAQVAQIIRTTEGSGPSERTVQRHFARLGLNTRPDGSAPQAFGRFEAAAPGDLWTGDALHGPTIAGRKTYLFCFIDDHSRALVGYRWGLSEDTVRLEAAFRTRWRRVGVPKAVYLDNGSAMVSRSCCGPVPASGCAWCIPSPGRPQGRGKIERVFETVRIQFLVEVEARLPADVAELNRLFSAWVETVYHRRIHSETGQAPIERLLAGGPPLLPTQAALHEAFLWSEIRTVTKTATISLHSNTFEVDAALVGSRVEVVFDPFDLETVEIRFQGRSMGQGSRSPSAATRTPRPAPKRPRHPHRRGIDYLGLLAERREAELAQSINYAQLTLDGKEVPYPTNTNENTNEYKENQQ